MSTTTFLPRPAVPLSAIAAQSERNQAAVREATAQADLARDIAERKPVAAPLFKKMDMGPGHRHYAVADTGQATTTVLTYEVDRDLVNLTFSTAAGEHYTSLRFTAEMARAVAAELIEAADSLSRGARA